ncbi:MAG: HAD hydrolase-like protein [Bacteroidales bacterium]|nr:HAD hydrolase-like protein [Bacteroidales bacterium]
MFQNIIFDLDGTLTDSKRGIINSYLYAIEKLGLETPSPEVMDSYIGPPLQEIFEYKLGLSSINVKIAVVHFRKYFSENGIYENKVYPGVLNVLKALHKNGRRIFLASSKLEKFVHVVLNHFQLSSFFSDVAGADYEGNSSDKSFLINKILENNKITDRNQTIMIGDTTYDILGARNNRIKSLAVTYGYGVVTELKNCDPDFLANTVEEMASLLLPR